MSYRLDRSKTDNVFTIFGGFFFVLVAAASFGSAVIAGGVGVLIWWG
tara:strand:- start:186 stop:326 length:141 start_codon:yes stop_codon:yes gene_type:complete